MAGRRTREWVRGGKQEEGNLVKHKRLVTRGGVILKKKNWEGLPRAEAVE
jgi:hypothetical protein